MWKEMVMACLKVGLLSHPGETEEYHDKSLSGYPITRPIFEHDTS
jgi:hypothetical protein